ncbi:MAG: exodeoxyribonuclease VII small subunit [Gammaproteobacteria bacterium]
MTKETKTPDFEKALAELEAVVERLEQGDLSLENSLKDFERGVALARSCQSALTNAQQRVEKLIEENGQLSFEPFEKPDEN